MHFIIMHVQYSLPGQWTRKWIKLGVILRQKSEVPQANKLIMLFIYVGSSGQIGFQDFLLPQFT